MIKKYKWQLIISSIVTLLPMLFGALGGVILPDAIASRLGFGTGVTSVFFILPAILLVINWICVLVTVKLDKNAAQNSKIMSTVIWMIPVICLTSCSMIITASLGYTAHIYAVILAVIGFFFIMIGNYMPKIEKNRVLGVKTKWSLYNEVTWQKTHRFAGFASMIAGTLVLLLGLFFYDVINFIILIAVVAVFVVSTIVASYVYYCQEKRRTECDD